MKRLWQNYNLSIVLAALFFASWGLQAVFQVGVEKESWSAFLASTMENWESEFLQLLTFVVLTSFLIHKGSHESKDTDDEMQAQLTRIEKKLEKLEAQQSGEQRDGQPKERKVGKQAG